MGNIMTKLGWLPENALSVVYDTYLQIEATSRDLLLEVTSSESLASCKAVMDALVVGMCEEGLGLEGGEGTLCVEQGRVEDEGGQLLVLYPSRTDLTTDKIDVRRP